MNLSVQLAPKNSRGLMLSNPLMTASGTFGYGTETSHVFYDIQELGAIVCKGTTLKPRDGNRQPRIVETTGGTLNSIGWENIGVEALIRDKAPVWAKWKVPVIVNIAGESVEDYARMAELLDGVDGVSGLEINISCPNIQAGGIEFGANPDSAAEVTGVVRRVTSLPLLVKLTASTSDIAQVAQAVAEAGADALTLINTLKGTAIDINTGHPILGNVIGGLSGPAIKPVALCAVYQVAGAVDIPIVGCGGISTATDAIEFIMAGATAIQVGTVGFANPRAPLDIPEGIKEFMGKRNIEDINSLIGVARE